MGSQGQKCPGLAAGFLGVGRGDEEGEAACRRTRVEVHLGPLARIAPEVEAGPSAELRGRKARQWTADGEVGP